MNRARALLMLLMTVAVVLPMASGEAQAQPAVQTDDCGWSEFTRLPAFSTFPDTNTLVYQAPYSASPLHDTVIRGEAPQARYWSFAILDQARREIANLSDDEILVAGDGSYEVRVAFDCEGQGNCLQTKDAPAPVAPERIFYRLYVPDTDDTGGVGLPQLSYEARTGPDVAVGVPVEHGTCTDAYLGATEPLVVGSELSEALASPSGLEPAVVTPGADPAPQRNQGTGYYQVEMLRGTVPDEVVDAVQSVRGQGGFGATQDNAYLTFGYNMRQGNVVMTAKAPTYRKQHDTAANANGVDDGTEQVRYWSLCTTQESRPVDCLRDENVVLAGDGSFDVVIAPDCTGLPNCLRAGKLSTAGQAAVGILLYRNLLASDGFFNPKGPAECPAGETMFCGDYALVAHYLARP